MASAYAKNYDRIFGQKGRKPKARKSGSSRKTGCRCPSNAVLVKTSRGRGFVCLSKADKVSKRHGLTYVTHPFVKAVGCK